ncbi:MAG TPA: 16S rRNA (guanine(527)-N(7))-methyltransferase RsmG [Firmicutes bacterium]|nr:16S rRNA (guanine(527)-N(7))-methyltransferase RsmG [Bacillota bacterium]
MKLRAKLREGVKMLGLSLTPGQEEQFLEYYACLEQAGRKTNLTSIKGEDVIELHFLDSLTGALYLPFQKQDLLLDVGSGAGFPGLALKIYRPDLRLHIIDSAQKKLRFLTEVITRLSLEDVVLFHGRAEEYGQKEDFRGKYPWVAARALAPLPSLLELCLPFVATGGIFCAYKGPEGLKELNDSFKALSFLGGVYLENHRLTLPYTGANRCLLFFQKEKESKPQYPRRAGLPARKPIQ